jgi:rubrerythrin
VDHQTLEALAEALDDEYHAQATYRKVIEVFGPIRPFINIVEAEARHIEAIKRQYARLGATPPDDAWAGRVEAPASLAQACADGVAAEIENSKMYDQLIAMIDDPAARQVMENLREASQERHLPAFRRCAARYRRG